jgi:organic radical activating enzyme
MEMYYTLQGEGFHCGRPAFFVRLGGCDVGCVWCDVKESWDADRYPLVEESTIVTEALRHPARFVVITGGEPCLYDLTLLTGQLKEAGFEVALETSGAYPIIGNFDWICVSPKKFKPPLSENLKKANELKCIIYNPSDFRWAQENAAGVSPTCLLYLQPEYSVMQKMLPVMIDFVKAHPHWALRLQTHKFMNIP